MVLSWLGLEKLTRDYKCRKEFSWTLGNPVYYRCKLYQRPEQSTNENPRIIPICRFSPSVLDNFVLKRKLKCSYVYFS